MFLSSTPRRAVAWHAPQPARVNFFFPLSLRNVLAVLSPLLPEDLFARLVTPTFVLLIQLIQLIRNHLRSNNVHIMSSLKKNVRINSPLPKDLAGTQRL